MNISASELLRYAILHIIFFAERIHYSKKFPEKKLQPNPSIIGRRTNRALHLVTCVLSSGCQQQATQRTQNGQIQQSCVRCLGDLSLNYTLQTQANKPKHTADWDFNKLPTSPRNNTQLYMVSGVIVFSYTNQMYICACNVYLPLMEYFRFTILGKNAFDAWTKKKSRKPKIDEIQPGITFVCRTILMFAYCLQFQ